MAERDPAFGQIVRGKLQRDLVARQHANAIAAKPARQMRKNDALMFQLDTKQTARKLLEHGSRYLNTVFLTHSTSLFPDSADSRRSV